MKYNSTFYFNKLLLYIFINTDFFFLCTIHTITNRYIIITVVIMVMPI